MYGANMHKKNFNDKTPKYEFLFDLRIETYIFLVPHNPQANSSHEVNDFAT